MSIKKCILIVLVLILPVISCFAMDNELQNPEFKMGLFGTLPIEVLGKVLHFITLNNPHALKDLRSIQQVCKSLTGILSNKQIQFVLNLNQDMLDKELWTLLPTVNIPDPKNSDLKKIEFLINLGAHVNLVSLLRGQELDQYPHGRALILSLFDSNSEQNSYNLLFFLINNRDDANALTLLFNNKREEVIKVLKKLDDTSKESLLAATESEQVAKILLDAGCKLLVNCTTDNNTQSLKNLVDEATRTKDPSALIAALRNNYTLKTATAIALALITGASIGSAICTLLPL